MAWMCLLGFVLVLAEAGAACVRTYLHLMAFRTGRAFFAFFAATICFAAAPSEMEVAIAGVGQSGSAPIISTTVNWGFLAASILLVLAGGYNLEVSRRSLILKKKLAQTAPEGKTVLM